jgi:hypothetical protein
MTSAYSNTFTTRADIALFKERRDRELLREEFVKEHGEEDAKRVERENLEELACYFNCSVEELPKNLRNANKQ